MQVTRQELKEFFTLANENGVGFEWEWCMGLSIDDCIDLIVDHNYTVAKLEAKRRCCPSPEAYLEWNKYLNNNPDSWKYQYCIGITKKGKMCGRYLPEDSNLYLAPERRYCWQHISQASKLDNSEKCKGGK